LTGSDAVVWDIFEKLSLYLRRCYTEPHKKREHYQELYTTLERDHAHAGAAIGMLLLTIVEERGSNVKISITNSNVGNVNMGEQLGAVNASVQVLSAKPDQASKDMASALKDLTESVHKDTELSPEQKKEALELLAEVANQSQVSPEKRSKGVIKGIVSALATVLTNAKTVSDLWVKWGATVSGFFQL
jgi:hypothetical protein